MLLINNKSTNNCNFIINFASNLNLFVCKKIRVNKNKFDNPIKIKNSNCSLKTKDVKNENKTNETVEKHAGMSTKKYEENNCTLTHDNLSERKRVI
ncbi:hypothetical protein CJJ19_05840 [Candidatus Williamhamiltonella defendens]|nr:hypothetical protein CJJ19_05840 [Candidatus Hamiltonella defensa]